MLGIVNTLSIIYCLVHIPYAEINHILHEWRRLKPRDPTANHVGIRECPPSSVYSAVFGYLIQIVRPRSVVARSNARNQGGWTRLGMRGKVSHIPSSSARRASTMGCKVAGPFAWAMAPTANGNLGTNISLQLYEYLLTSQRRSKPRIVGASHRLTRQHHLHRLRH